MSLLRAAAMVTSAAPSANSATAAATASWKARLQGALAKNRSLANARYVQLATVRPDGRPANRTVVFRCAAAALGTPQSAVACSRTAHLTVCLATLAWSRLALHPKYIPLPCRGFLGESTDITFVTDKRSSKVTHRRCSR